MYSDVDGSHLLAIVSILTFSLERSRSILCSNFVSFSQLAVLFHGTNESIDWPQIASNSDTDGSPRMG